MTPHVRSVLFVLLSLAVAVPVGGVPPAREVYSEDHRFLIRLLSVPTAIRLQKYFAVRLAVFDGHDIQRRLSDVEIEVAAGMAHGMATGFAHGMQSAPQVEMRDGVATVSGLFFHMPGEWTVRVTVHYAGEVGTGSFQLPCCAQ